jgi:hypothetical protein
LLPPPRWSPSPPPLSSSISALATLYPFVLSPPRTKAGTVPNGLQNFDIPATTLHNQGTQCVPALYRHPAISCEIDSRAFNL